MRHFFIQARHIFERFLIKKRGPAAHVVRVMATMHGIGEAAGIAAAEAVRRGTDVTAIPGEWVRSQIGYMAAGPDHGPLWDRPDPVFDHTPAGVS